MDSLFFHPKVVHIPLALAVLMPLISGTCLLAWRRGWLVPKSWALAVALQIILVGSGITAIRTGGAEEERVEKVVAERYIEHHEDAAKAFVAAGAAVLLLMLGGLMAAEKRYGLPLAAAATVGTLVVLVLSVRAGHEGGELVYERGAASVYVNAGSQSPSHQPPDAAQDADEHGEQGDDGGSGGSGGSSGRHCDDD